MSKPAFDGPPGRGAQPRRPRWTSVSPDPNSPASRAYRQAQLDRAWRPLGGTRLSIVTDLCRNKRVLDLGCVNHVISGVGDPSWLHPRIVAVAQECLGVDSDSRGICEMRKRGFNVLCADVLHYPWDESYRERFDVVVAGELIEHVDRPLAILEIARTSLVPGGFLVVTTPNPYAPWRVRCGHMRIVWENVDHVAYFFPSGMAELADRAGLQLCTWATVRSSEEDLQSLRKSARDLLRAVANRSRGVRGGDRSGRLRLPLDPAYFAPGDILTRYFRRARDQMGESSVYVFQTASVAR